MSLKDRINNDLKDAMRSKEKQTLEALRFVMAAIKQVEVDERIVPDDARVTQLIDKLAKQRKESISHFQKANRQDLVAKEEFELALISKYLPAPLTETEVLSIIDKAIKDANASSIRDLGKVVAQLKDILQGRADMSNVIAIIKSKLNTD